ncbi:MAG: radical SAM protein [Thermodesulfobacteriota bacterium]
MPNSHWPAYLGLAATGELTDRIARAREGLAACSLCPRACGKDRTAGELGICRTGRRALVASCAPHFGEEAPLVGRGGSGTIFFTSCNLLCRFCQNYEISHLGEGVPVSPEQLAAMMLELQGQGCHNINFVTPSHVVPQILEALPAAIAGGLRLPLVYNTSAYDALSTLALLDGIVDIYMPDMKFWEPASAGRWCSAADYPERARAAIAEMHRQVGDLVLDPSGLARRGLLVRHLVMPGGLAETREIVRWLAREISPDTYTNIMDQYRPCGTARQDPVIGRPLDQEEFHEALRLAQAAGLRRLDQRDWRQMLRWLQL